MISSPSVDEINFIFSQLADRLDQMEGWRGQPKFQANLDLGNNRATNLAPAADQSDAVSKDQASILVGGLVPTDNLGTGTALASSYLRGDQTWKNIAGGSFTLDAAATKTVNNSAVTGSAIILVFPTNAAGATLMNGIKSLYLSAKTAGVSFEVATANGTNAVGTEIFNYLIFN